MRTLDYSRILLSWGSMIQKPISDPPQDPRQAGTICPFLSFPRHLVSVVSRHFRFHCLTSASVAPFKCRSWKASPTGKAPALYNSFHPTAKHLCWAFDYIVLYVSPSYCLRSSFFHSTALERLPRNS